MKSRKAVKTVVIAAVLIAAVAAGVRWWMNSATASDEAAAQESTASVTHGPLRETVECPGRVVSNLDVEIKCRASGQVTKLPFDVSDAVKEGDLVLELDPVDQQRMVQQAEAALSASKARLAQAVSTLAVAQENLEAAKQKTAAAVQGAEARAVDADSKAKREKQLLEKKYSSTELVETAQTTAVQAEQNLKTAQSEVSSVKAQELDLETKRQAINLAKAQVDSDTIALGLAQRQLGYTSVYSPITGFVATRTVQIGQIISSGISNVGGGTTVLTISDLSRVFILGSVAEANIGSVELGQPAEIRADALPGKRFAGTVNRIATKGISLQGVVTFEVRIEVLDENRILLKPEMTGDVTIVIADKPDVLLAPATAISRNKGDTVATLKNPDGTVEENHAVETGITDGENTEIVAGLNEGDVVVLRRPEDESRWATGDPRQAARQRMMMMRTVGGAGRGGGGHIH